ncbi:EamA family transporter [Halalkalibacter okhensis]|uniref:Multidrug DMT transporter permease n=1 Tax=Halalkalibacter okhensis TaxID=333138 RepID=A0A0B0IGQ1_9BACI|nr:DMT family transporter [Halalkalibacter okhensis]KHF41768.1 multidrug DMT transporter permease [Halalkalibacter okhensis]
MKMWHYACFVFLAGCCFGILSTFVKLAYEAGFTVGAVTGGQFLIGTVLIFVLSCFTKRNKLTFKEMRNLLLTGIPMGLTGIFYYHSLQTLDASLAIIFLFQFIWIGALLEWILEKKRTSREKKVAICILLIGSLFATGLLVEGNVRFSLNGALWGILAAFSFATFIYVSGTVGRAVPPVQKSSFLALGGFFIVAVWFPPVFLLEGSTVMGVFPYSFVLGLFGVALPPLLFSIGMPHIGAGLGTILSASELPVAIILSTVVLSETIHWTQWLGVFLIILGIVVGNSKLKFNKPITEKEEASL